MATDVVKPLRLALQSSHALAGNLGHQFADNRDEVFALDHDPRHKARSGLPGDVHLAEVGYANHGGSIVLGGFGKEPWRSGLKLGQMSDYSELSPSQIFLEAFRRHGAGISVVTALKTDGSPTGFTATSLASLSAAPPLATFNMSQTASSWSSMKVDQTVIIHMLSADNLDLAQTMAGEASERFAGDHWSPGPDDLPLLKGVSAWLHAKIVDTMEVEFSATVALRILGGNVGPGGDALVYQGKDYRRTSSLT